MSEAKYTKGPWKFVPLHEFPFGYEIRSADDLLIEHQNAACHATGQKTRKNNLDGIGFDGPQESNWSRDKAIMAIETQDANGKLKAAAPELLEALEEAIAALKVAIDEYGSTMRPAWITGMNNDIAAIDAVIAKAKGIV